MSVTKIIDEENITIVQGVNGILLDKESIFESIAVFYKKSFQIRAKFLPSLLPGTD